MLARQGLLSCAAATESAAVFSIHGAHRVAIIVDAFNVFNRTNFLIPNNTFGSGTAPPPSFGRPIAAAAPPPGEVAIAWDEIFEGRRTAAMRLLTPGAAEPFGPTTMLGKEEPAAYSVLAATGDGLIAVWTARGADDKSSIRVQRLPGR